MMKKTLRAVVMAVITGLASFSILQPALAADEVFLKMDSIGVTSGATAFSISFSEIVQKNLPYKIQLSTGKAATRMAVEASKKEIDLFVTSAAINSWFSAGKVMYKKMPDAKEKFKNLRAIMNYPLGAYHMIVWDDSDIKTLKDIKGKRVFLGPPAGAATRLTTLLVKQLTGYQPNIDFRSAKLDWNSAQQAFQDRQLDLYIVPTNIPSGSVMQLASLGKFRLLGIPEDMFTSSKFKNIMSIPGRTVERIPAGIYGKNQMNKTDVHGLGSWIGLGTHKWLDEKVVYNMTKALFENLDRLADSAEWMKVISLKTALTEMNMPLHVGAYRYYREQGMSIPKALIPPEAM